MTANLILDDSKVLTTEDDHVIVYLFTLRILEVQISSSSKSDSVYHVISEGVD